MIFRRTASVDDRAPSGDTGAGAFASAQIAIIGACRFLCALIACQGDSIMAQYQKRQAVFCCIVPAEFHPQRPWDVPPRFDFVELVAKNLSAVEANHLARSLNRRQMETGLADRKWWFVFHSIKPGCHGGKHRSHKVALPEPEPFGGYDYQPARRVSACRVFYALSGSTNGSTKSKTGRVAPTVAPYSEKLSDFSPW